MRESDRPTDTSPRRRPRLKKLRLLVILVPLTLLAAISTVFGMMMAVASDLPALENEPAYRTAADTRNSTVRDVNGRLIGRLASDQNRIFVKYGDISSFMRSAVIAIEDERYVTNNGVDLRAIGRAFTQDVIQQRAAQGGSTITQQFVKNALQAQSQRTVFQKLRESALAYHLTRRWGKKKILQEYLNSIYFGNGAYGIEAAAQTYFGREPGYEDCGKTARRPCAKLLRPHEAAFLAGVIASPSGYDPVANYKASEARRNIVLSKMLEQGYINRRDYDVGIGEVLPGKPRAPRLDAKYDSEHFVSWVRQQLVDRYGAQRAFEGGLEVRTTLDLPLQAAAERSVRGYLANPDGPTAALVAIDNDSGEVRAMVSGTKPYQDAPFNLATQGQRQPGSAFKPFILAQALKDGIGPGKVYPSRKRQFCVTRTKRGCSEQFVVNNFENTYTGQRTLANALTYSDNAVYAAAGIEVGTKRVAKLTRRMGIRTPVSSNLAMTLGGLEQGVTPLDMAHAYETFQTGGRRISGTLGSSDDGPVGISKVLGKDGEPVGGGVNRTTRIPVLSQVTAQTATQVMSTVISQGTGRRAAIDKFAAGKTGTTENSGDAWFVGFTDRLTVAVWVGYPDGLKPMQTEFQGGPVEGGTFPALIWHDFIVAANEVLDERVAAEREREGLPPLGPTGSTGPALPSVPSVPAAPVVPEGGLAGDAIPEGDGGTPVAPKAPAEAAPQPQQQPEPTPEPEGAPPPAPATSAAPAPPAAPAHGAGGASAAPPAP